MKYRFPKKRPTKTAVMDEVYAKGGRGNYIYPFMVSGFWSRRIDKKNRLVYRIVNQKLEIAQCGTHYE